MALPILGLLISMISIQFGASLAKGLFPIVGAYGATTLRLSIASIILLAIWRPWRFKFSRKTYISIIIYGISLGLMNMLFYISLERIPLGIAVALEFTGPLAVTLLHSRKPMDFLWAALAIVGLALIFPFEKEVRSVDPIGILFALGAGACWGMYIHFGKKAGDNEHGGIITSIGMFFAALVVLPFSVFFSIEKIFTLNAFQMAVMVAILSSALPYSLEMIALKKIPTKTFGILMSLEPAIAAVMGLIFLQESLSLKEYLAIFCIISASFGGALNMKKETPQ